MPADVDARAEAASEAGTWLEEARRWSEGELERFTREADLGPPEIAEAVRYALLGGGKRIRPALVKLVGGAIVAETQPDLSADLQPGPEFQEALSAAAVAVECVHTYSLVHDDLPCMDDDDLRRGRATVHRAFDEATAVLAGDALLTVAFEWIARHLNPGAATQAVLCLARAAGPAGMVGGQALDLASEGQATEVDGIRRIHELKTACLLGAAAELGAIAAGADAQRRGAAARFGYAVGRTFQAVDDVLDVISDAATLGKTPGKDAASEKGTLVAALGLAGAREEAQRHAEEARKWAFEARLGPAAAGIVEWLAGRTR